MYAQTRHTLGARVVEALQQRLLQAPFRLFRTTQVRLSRGAVLLAIPTTFMNRSGETVETVVRKFRVPLDRLLIVHDDKDLAFGQLKLQRGRSAAGHRGVESIIAALNSREFWRLRIGLGASPSRTPTEVFVLEPFASDEERRLTATVIPQAVQTILATVGIR
ncbi:MAG: peptidyl-tRNA hydrolase, PTH1 family [Parcubacteria group bacterium Gr01-1014_38]|nr:MAG: peptidyl-tRNA hydrolase, PTH1 family [Parcubacteria group bacterium Gr01-1014_38]